MELKVAGVQIILAYWRKNKHDPKKNKVFGSEMGEGGAHNPCVKNEQAES